MCNQQCSQAVRLAGLQPQVRHARIEGGRSQLFSNSLLNGLKGSLGSKDYGMAQSKKKFLIVNVLYWVVAALLHPLANLLPTGSGEVPKVFSLLIPLAFVALAFASTYMISLALDQQKDK